MSTWDLLLPREELVAEARQRATTHISKKISKEELQSYLDSGWEESRTLKHKVEVRRAKPTGSAFEDKVWSVFYKMGFKILNKSNQFNLSYKECSLHCTKQIDVIAMDDEVCLFIECKASEKIDKTKSWKTELEAMSGYYQGIAMR